MQKITCDASYFNPRDVLECGQIFRFFPYKDGFKVFTKDKAAYLHTDGVTTTIECEDGDYFYNFFDLGREYGPIIAKLEEFGIPALTRSARLSKGLRLLNQDAEETVFSFIISQNNNIPRIKQIIERICGKLGDERTFMGETFYTFPSCGRLASEPPEFYRALGAGYRDGFIVSTAKRIEREGLEHLKALPVAELRKALLTYRGIGPKVADCITLFGFGRGESFPVDTWVEKIYREDFGGTLKDRNKISAYFTSLFGQYSGLVQQYLFYAKRAHL